MASIKKRGSSYLLSCYDGYDQNGKQIVRTKTWQIPEGMTAKKAEKAARAAAVLFEEQVKKGLYISQEIKFADFADKWMQDYAKMQLRPRTVQGYESLLKRLNKTFGHIYIDKIRPVHLSEFYVSLSKEETDYCKTYIANTDLRQFLKDRNITQEKLKEMSGVGVTTIRAAENGTPIAGKQASLIASALECDIDTLFRKSDSSRDGKVLSGKTILHYHRLLSVMFQTAVEWQLLSDNPAKRVKPPKAEKKEAPYLDDVQAIHLLELLDELPVTDDNGKVIYEKFQNKIAVQVLLFTGMRRGELLGLEWRDIDFDNSIIDIRRTSLYIPGTGVFTDQTKNISSTRVIKVPEIAMQAISELQRQQRIEKMRLGQYWQDSGRLFVGADGSPLHPDTLSNWFHKYIRTTDLDNIHLHSLRHTNATLMIAKGIDIVDVASQLGHANSSTTSRIYAHAIMSAKAAAADAIDNIFTQKARNA